MTEETPTQAAIPLSLGGLAQFMGQLPARPTRVDGEWELETLALRCDVRPATAHSTMESLFVGSANGVFTTAVRPAGTRAYARPVEHVVPRRLPCGHMTIGVVRGVQLVDETGEELAMQLRPAWAD